MPHDRLRHRLPYRASMVPEVGWSRRWASRYGRAGWRNPEAAVARACAQGEALAISGKTLSKRLAEKGLLVGASEDRVLLKKTINGIRRRVLAVKRDAILQNSVE